MAADETHKGFKTLTADNWRDLDEVTQYFSRDPDTWIVAFLQPQLGSQVPQDISALFEVARGAMIYGWHFYPLLTLGMEQCYRINEAGLRVRCKQLEIATAVVSKNGNERPRSFLDLQRELMARGVIPAGDVVFWDAARDLRNWASHPEQQPILPPGEALAILRRTAEMLDVLFRAP